MTELEELKAKVKELSDDNERLKTMQSPLSRQEMKKEIMKKIGAPVDYGSQGNINRDEMAAIYNYVMWVK